MTKAETDSPFLTIGEVAELIGVSAGRAYQMVQAGELPAIRLGTRRIRVPRVAFAAWIESQERKAVASVPGLKASIEQVGA